MCRILANLIDNAIEAVSSDELKGLDPEFKVIDLVFRKTEKFFMISIKNPCAKNTEMIGERYVSGKKDPENHGFGLESIRNAALRYEGEMSIDLKEKPYGYDFTAELLFPYDPV
jgi:sensor histidine kinase regulating citrate/malate metabolism